MDTAKAACDRPNASSGRVYMLTLKAATAKVATEMAAADQPGEPAAGIAALTNDTTAAATHTRKRAAIAGTPPFTRRNDSHPPASPPSSAEPAGISAHRAAAGRVSRYTSTR